LPRPPLDHIDGALHRAGAGPVQGVLEGLGSGRHWPRLSRKFSATTSKAHTYFGTAQSPLAT
ncbi:MAG: hypothetical protein WBL91_01520, partial [Pseudolabrys sp.]